MLKYQDYKDCLVTEKECRAEALRRLAVRLQDHTQTSLAKEFKISLSYFHEIYHGKRAMPEHMLKALLG